MPLMGLLLLVPTARASLADGLPPQDRVVLGSLPVRQVHLVDRRFLSTLLRLLLLSVLASPVVLAQTIDLPALSEALALSSKLDFISETVLKTTASSSFLGGLNKGSVVFDETSVAVSPSKANSHLIFTPPLNPSQSF